MVVSFYIVQVKCAFSSVDLLKKEMLKTDLSSIIRPINFPKRHGFTMADLRETIDKFKGIRVTVLGDIIVDEYIDCDPLGMSQEDPTIVVTPIQNEKFVGGAAIVAAHARSLGADVRFISVLVRIILQRLLTVNYLSMM